MKRKVQCSLVGFLGVAFALNADRSVADSFDAIEAKIARAFASWQCSYLAQVSGEKAALGDDLFKQGKVLFVEAMEDEVYEEYLSQESTLVPMGILKGEISTEQEQFKLGYLWAFTKDWTQATLKLESVGRSDEQREALKAASARREFKKRNCTLILQASQ